MTEQEAKNPHVIIGDKALQEAFSGVVQTTATDEPIITQVFVTDDEIKTPSEVVNGLQYLKDGLRTHSDNINAVDTVELRIKEAAYETSERAELGYSNFDLSDIKVIEPPFPPEILSKLLEVDEVHFRCCRCKVTDWVGREYSILPKTLSDGANSSEKIDPKEKKAVDKEIKEAREFIEDCNPILGFDGVSDRSAMDHDAIGWGSIEVVRGLGGKAAKITHLPSPRLKVLKGFRGFKEDLGAGKSIYYQNFGEKLLSKKRKNPITDEKEYYNPREDGPISAGNFDWNLIDRDTGKKTSNPKKAANEILYIPRHHSNSVYYGIPDILPALGSLMGNAEIRDYMLQFFEYNTVPQYAIIIKGAKLDDAAKKAIIDFFKEKVKGKAHQTLIIPLPMTASNIEIKFEKLGTENESGFQETRKNNSNSIMVAHGVSPAIIGIADHSELGSGKGLSQAEIYKDRIVSPGQKRFQTVWGKLFKFGLGLNLVELIYTPLDIRDLKAEMEVYTGYIKSGGASVNEIRRWAQLGDPIPGGDRHFIQIGDKVYFIDEMKSIESTDVMSNNSAIEQTKLRVSVQKESIKQASKNSQTKVNQAKQQTPQQNIEGTNQAVDKKNKKVVKKLKKPVK